MDRSFRNEYPEHKKYQKKKKFPTWIIIIICLILSVLPGYLFLIHIKTQYHDIFDKSFKKNKTITQTKQPERFWHQKTTKIIKPPQDTTEKIYSWTDEAGIKHFSNVQPSQNSKNVMTTN